MRRLQQKRKRGLINGHIERIYQAAQKNALLGVVSGSRGEGRVHPPAFVGKFQARPVAGKGASRGAGHRRSEKTLGGPRVLDPADTDGAEKAEINKRNNSLSNKQIFRDNHSKLAEISV